MAVSRCVMGPERLLPPSEDLGEDGAPLWGGDGDGGGAHLEGEGGAHLEGGEEEEEEGGEEEEEEGGYYYQPLNQEPDGEEAPSHTEQLQQLQHRIQVLGLHLPAPPADSEEEEEEEEEAAQRSRSSIPMDEDHVELVKRTMAAVALPSLGVPPWARDLSEAQWSAAVQTALQSRQSAASLRLPRRSTTGP